MTSADGYLLPEQKARVRIDEMLTRAGWLVQDYRSINLYAGLGVAVRELVTTAGPADYVLFVNRQAVGVIEAKKEGTTLSGVEWQTVKYQTHVPDELPALLVDGFLPYGYESTGIETWFTCRFDPEPTARHVQHVKTLLKVEGSAAIVVPDNVLFEGGAGETIRRRLLHECDVHTLLRLPTGIFYAQGVKANVLFFDRKPGSDTPWTKELWIYDLRTNLHFTLKTNPLTRADLDDFVASYQADDRSKREESDRFHRFDYDELATRDKASLDIVWLRDESLEDTDNLPPPGVIAAEIVEDLEAALAEFTELADSLADVGAAEDK